jgi:hypothetical protein
VPALGSSHLEPGWARLGAVKPEEWDWSRVVVDHLDLEASRFADSVRFYEAVLTPLGIPKL